MRLELFPNGGSLFLLFLAVIGTMTTIVGGGGSSQAWADVIEGTEGNDVIFGTPEADLIDSKGGIDQNFGDTHFRGGSGNDVILSGEGVDENWGDSFDGDGTGDDVIVSEEGDDVNWGDAGGGGEGAGSGNDIIASGEEDDTNSGGGGRDIFVCGGGEQDTVTDYNEEEGDIATPDCENRSEERRVGKECRSRWS